MVDDNYANFQNIFQGVVVSYEHSGFSKWDGKTRMTIGGQLRSARQQRGLSLGTVAEETKISSHYLEAIETDQPAKLPGTFFYKSFVRQYALALNLNPERLMPVETEPEPQPLAVVPAAPVRDRDRFVKLLDSPHLANKRLVATVAALIGVLAGGAILYSFTQTPIEQESTVISSPAPERR